MASSQSEAEWEGNLKEGRGTFRTQQGALFGDYSFLSRFENGTGSNPEELLGAAHAGCFSMALAHALSEAGYHPQRIRTKAKVHLNAVAKGFAITRIDLYVEGEVPDIDDHQFAQMAEETKVNCPVSKAIHPDVQVKLEAKLKAKV